MGLEGSFEIPKGAGDEFDENGNRIRKVDRKAVIRSIQGESASLETQQPEQTDQEDIEPQQPEQKAQEGIETKEPERTDQEDLATEGLDVESAPVAQTEGQPKPKNTNQPSSEQEQTPDQKRQAGINSMQGNY